MARTPKDPDAPRRKAEPARPASAADEPNNVEEASMESMVASDPPSFTGTTSGSPDHLAVTSPFAEAPEGVSAEDEATITRIRERAYDLWQQEGSPEGREMEFWLAAEREFREGRG
ncbi:DUF2934 domain-containing protein [Geminicoccaceae bacterium 1502E]|nr:DUF2934 domain-containing protein [Geminicoccaceae bacterium 1502E]